MYSKKLIRCPTWALFCWEILDPVVHVGATLKHNTLQKNDADQVYVLIVFPNGSNGTDVQKWFDKEFMVLTPNDPNLNPIKDVWNVRDKEV